MSEEPKTAEENEQDEPAGASDEIGQLKSQISELASQLSQTQLQSQLAAQHSEQSAAAPKQERVAPEFPEAEEHETTHEFAARLKQYQKEKDAFDKETELLEKQMAEQDAFSKRQREQLEQITDFFAKTPEASSHKAELKKLVLDENNRVKMPIVDAWDLIRLRKKEAEASAQTEKEQKRSSLKASEGVTDIDLTQTAESIDDALKVAMEKSFSDGSLSVNVA